MMADPVASAVLPPDLRLHRFLCDLAAELVARPVVMCEPFIMRQARELASLMGLPPEKRGPSWRRDRRVAARRFCRALHAVEASRENVERQVNLGWSVRS